jgi:inorganic pyrophosphatase
MYMNLQLPQVEVVIEIPRGSFLKRGWDGSVDFISPFPCPFNYGAIQDYIGGDGDLLDAVVLGPRLSIPWENGKCICVWGDWFN